METGSEAGGAAMIFLLILYSMSLLLSSSVLLFLLSIGIQTRSGILTFFLNLSFLLITLTKFPVVLVKIPFVCAIAGYCYWYFSTFGLLVLYDLVGAVNLRMLATNDSTRTISRSSEYKLENINFIRLLIFPLLVLIIPLICGSFIRGDEYCEIDRESRKGIIARSAYLITTLIFQMAILRKLYHTCHFLKQTFSETSYQHLLWKLMTGPGAYPIYLLVSTIIADIFILITYLTSSHLKDSETHNDQSDYSLEVLQATLGVIAAVIFYVFERNDIQVRIHPTQFRATHYPTRHLNCIIER